MDQSSTQQVLTVTVWLSLIAVTLSILAVALAWSARKTKAVEQVSEAPRPAIPSLHELERKVDEAVADRVNQHLQNALGRPDSPTELAKAILNHPRYLEAVVGSFTDRLSDPDDDLTSKLIQKVVAGAEEVVSTPETKALLRAAVSKQLMEETPDLLTDDDDLREAMLGSFQKLLPDLIKELMNSDEEFRKKMAEALTARVDAILDNN